MFGLVVGEGCRLAFVVAEAGVDVGKVGRCIGLRKMVEKWLKRSL